MTDRQPDQPKWRSYTDQERADAVGLALAIGAKKAAAQLSIPRRTISSWLLRPSTEMQAAIVSSRQDVAARLWEAVSAGTEAVLEGLRDPKARLGDKASALRIVVEAHALVAGQPTSRVASVDESNGISADDADRLADWLERAIFEGHDPAEIIEAVRPQLTGGSSDVG